MKLTVVVNHQGHKVLVRELCGSCHKSAIVPEKEEVGNMFWALGLRNSQV